MSIERIEPGPGQESVWDYPRPPSVADSHRHIRVVFNGQTIADTTRAQRVLETSHPPVYYIPLEDIKTEYLKPTSRQTICEYKGAARYYTVTVGDRSTANAAWYYPDPEAEYLPIKNYVAFYSSLMDACYVDDEQVQEQMGGFYGGWVTSEIVGPFKGGPGTLGW